MFESKNKDQKLYRRIAPCPSYDIEGTESWLAYMAEKGFMLVSDGIYFTTFMKREPCKVRYRLDTVAELDTLYPGDDAAPSLEARDLSSKYGWEYVCVRGAFCVYRSNDPDARELNTEPRVQAQAMEKVYRAYFRRMLYIVWLGFYSGYWLLRDGLFLSMFKWETWLVLFGFVLIIWMFAAALRKTLSLGRIRKKLLADISLDHDKPWKKRISIHNVTKMFFVPLLIVWFGLLISKMMDPEADQGWIEITDFKAAAPFATMADFYAENELGKITGRVTVGDDLLAPVIVEWVENNEVSSGYGETARIFQVEYHETAAPWIARAIAREHCNQGEHVVGYEEIEVPELNADYAVAFAFDDGASPIVVIQKGCVVIKALYSQSTDSVETHRLTFEEWATIVADSI